MASHIVQVEDVDRTISAFTRLDQRGDKKAMNKLAQRLQKEQPFLLQHAAAVRNEHGDSVGEAAVFYATLVWSMFDRLDAGTLPQLTEGNLATAEVVVTGALDEVQDLAAREPYDRVAPSLVATQPHIYAKLRELLTEDVKEAAMTADTCATIIKPVQVVIEAFDAAVSGRRPGARQGTIAAADKPGRNEPCSCGSGKKFKKCHGAA